MPTALTTNQIVASLKTPASQGTQVAVSQVTQVLDKQLQQAAAMLKLVILSMVQETHRNNVTTSQSDFAKATKVTMTTAGTSIDLPDFADDLDRGRKPGSFPPLKAILAWVLKYRIQSLGGAQKGKMGANQLAYAIRQSIYRHGVKPRPFLADVDKFAQDLMGKIIDEVILPNLVQPLESTFSDTP